MPQDALLRRLRAELLEMPGLRLTLEQAQYLCGVERALCQRILDTLVDVKFLCIKSNGAYARLIDGDSGSREGTKMPNIYLSYAELKALQDVFETADKVDWDAYERARARIRQARLETLHAHALHPHPAKAAVRGSKRFEQTG